MQEASLNQGCDLVDGSTGCGEVGRNLNGYKVGRRRQISILALIVCVIGALFWRVSGYDFVSYDDDLFVTENPMVRRGFSAEGLIWAFSNTTYFYPLTWLSLMLDSTLYGPDNAGGMHITNVILHTANSVLAYVLIREALKSDLTAAVASILFAVHPINVESVAWVSERKGLLSTSFMLASLVVYVRNCHSPSALKKGLVTGLYIAGMLAKPAIVMMPILMLVIDLAWLRRKKPLVWLLFEKLPIFALAAFFTFGTIITQRQAGASEVGQKLLSHGVLLQIMHNYVEMVSKLFWPTNLSFFYSHHVKWSVSQLAVSITLGAGTVAIMVIKKWFTEIGGVVWYILAMFPVCGIIQIGGHAFADRYSYVPAIGLFVAVAVAMQRIPFGPSRRQLFVVAGLTSCLAISSAFVASGQISVWRNSEALYRDALKKNPDNEIALNNLAWDLATAKQTSGPLQLKEAVDLAERACKVTNFEHIGMAHTLVTCYLKAGNVDKAKEISRRMVEVVKGDPRTDPMAAYFSSVAELQ